MAWQLIYTSAPRGLTSGQSGFCTVARSGDLREAVAQRLEQISSYHHLQLSSGGNPARNPIISAYRVLDIRGTKYHALTRIQATGLDFTARTNHLAQHLVFQADELARLPSPAAILHHWSGWLSCWQGEPRLLSALLADAFKEVPAPAWPAKAWERLTGDGGRAAALLESECVRGCYLLCPAGGEEDLLELFCETLQLPNFTGKYPQRAWQHTFTTFLQAEDALGDFEWRGCQPDTPAHQQAVRRSAPLLQLRTLRVPSNPLAKLAREGPKITSPNPPPASRAPLALRRQPSLMPPAKAPTPSPAIDFSQTEFVRRKPQVPESVGWTFSIRKTSLLAIGIALALLGGLIAIHRLHPTLKPITTLPSTQPKPAPGADQKSPPPAAGEVSSRSPAVPDGSDGAGSRVDMMKLNRQLEAVLPDVRTYVVMVPSLQGTNSVVLEGIGPLERLLPRINGTDLNAQDLEMLLSNDSWEFPVDSAVKVPPYVSGPRQLAGVGKNETLFLFDYSGLSAGPATGQSIECKTFFSKAPRAISILFRPAAARGGLFEPFRVLIVNAGNAPAPLPLDIHFLRPRAPAFLDSMTIPLRDRIAKFTLAPGVKWQLRPFGKLKPEEPAKYVYGDWDAPPEFGTELDFLAIRKRLIDELADLTNKVSRLEDQVTQANASMQASVDRNLNLGALLGSTNEKAPASFEEFLHFRGAARTQPTPPRLYLEFLDAFAKQARGCPWLSDWKAPDAHPESRLSDLYALCISNVPQSAGGLTLSGGPATNYFLAVWNNLQNNKRLSELQENKQKAEAQMAELSRRLQLVPRQTDQAAYVSLYLVGSGPAFLQEAIRFTPSAEAN